MVKCGVRRSVTLKSVKRSDGTKECQSAIASYLSLNSECAKAYCDDCLSAFIACLISSLP